MLTRLIQALNIVGVSNPSKCFFVDDSISNVRAAKERGWGRCVHFCERGLRSVEGGQVKEIGSDSPAEDDGSGIKVISNLEELRILWSEIFKA